MSRRNGTGLDTAVLGVFAVVLGATVCTWLWAGTAQLMAGRGWARATLAETGTAVLRLPQVLDDPRRAWPEPTRRQLPGPGAFAGAFLGLSVLATAAAALGRRTGLIDGLRASRGPRGKGARWATRRDLRPLLAPSGGGDGRIVLGRYGRRLVRAEHRHALVAFGPPQSGKSAGLAVPALLDWEGPAVASSIKTDLLAQTARHRGQLGDVLVFDPFSLSGLPAQTWSPLHSARTWDGALEVAARLASAGEVEGRGVEGGDFWGIAAEQRLAPLLFAAANAGAGMGNVVRWVHGQGGRQLDAALERAIDTSTSERQRGGAQAAYDAVQAFEAQADRTRSSIEATAQAMLRAYRFSTVQRSASGCEITADRLLDGSHTLYLIGDAKASKLLRPIFLALLGEIVDRAYERATLNGGALERPLLLCLDEAGNVAPLPNLAEIASTAPSHNIQLVTIFHDLQQARSRYRGQAETVINAHRARMLLPGVADMETLRLFSGLAGEGDAREITRTTGQGGTSRTSSRRRLPLVAPEALRQLPDRHALLLYGRIPPARVRLRTWFDDPRLKRMGGGL